MRQDNLYFDFLHLTVFQTYANPSVKLVFPHLLAEEFPDLNLFPFFPVPSGADMNLATINAVL